MHVGSKAAVVLLVLATGAAWVLWERCGVRGCPDLGRLRGFAPDEAAVVLDRRGTEIARISRVDQVLVPLDSLPGYVPAAFVAVEDQRFWEHGGVDLRRVLGAAVANLRSGGIQQGASTITMQLARNAFPGYLPYRERTVRRKLVEMRVAREIETRYTKRQILELYLNRIYFGSGAWGIEAAAREYFDKPAAALTLAETALLTGLVSAPQWLNPRTNPRLARGRRGVVLELMADAGVITAQAAAAAAAAPLVTGGGAWAGGRSAAYFVQKVRTLLEQKLGPDLYTAGYTIHTTLDARLQARAEAELRAQLDAVEEGRYGPYGHPRHAAAVASDSGGRHASAYLQGAVLALEAETGDVLAMVGGRDFRDSRFNRATLTRRPPASTFKPFIYAAALAGGYTPVDRLGNRPLQRTVGGATWSPRNRLGEYTDSISIRDALVTSSNVATVRLAEEIGLDAVIRMARRLGLRGPLPRVPALALGVGEVSLSNLTAAYATFATLGRHPDPRIVNRVEDPAGQVVWRGPRRVRDVLDPAAAFLVTDMLRDAVDRGTGYGVRAAGFRGPVAGKTGTTTEATDLWFVGYTPSVVTGVWIGLDVPRPITAQATAAQIAAPLWGRIMRAHPSRAEPGWTPPAAVETLPVDTAGRAYPPDCASAAGLPTEYFPPGSAAGAACPPPDTARPPRAVEAAAPDTSG